MACQNCGACCTSFNVPIPITEVIENFEEWKAYYEGFPGVTLDYRPRLVTNKDGVKGTYKVPVLTIKKRCKYYDDHRKRCKIYDQRRKPCRDYMCPRALKGEAPKP